MSVVYKLTLTFISKQYVTILASLEQFPLIEAKRLNTNSRGSMFLHV